MSKAVEAEAAGARSAGMSAGLARNWWAVASRGAAALLFGLAVLLLPRSTLASLTVLFAAYLAGDGVFAILAGTRAARAGERWGTWIVEGATNLTVAGAILAWHSITIVPLLPLASTWAVVTGALLLAAAGRLAGPHGRPILILAGAASAGWGGLVAAAGPTPDSPARTTGLWLMAYAVVFGAMLGALAFRLRQRDRESIVDG